MSQHFPTGILGTCLEGQILTSAKNTTTEVMRCYRVLTKFGFKRSLVSKYFCRSSITSSYIPLSPAYQISKMKKSFSCTQCFIFLRHRNAFDFTNDERKRVYTGAESGTSYLSYRQQTSFTALGTSPSGAYFRY